MMVNLDRVVDAWPGDKPGSGPVIYRGADGLFWLETIQGDRWKGLGGCGPFESRAEAVTAYLGTGPGDPKDRPSVVCLCGSSRFKDAFIEANRSETLAGRIVLSIGMFGHHEGLDMDGPVKAMLDRLHLHKIDLADEVLVLNVGGYIGESTRREIEYAASNGKPLRYLETV